jgi:hypothetical protein
MEVAAIARVAKTGLRPGTWKSLMKTSEKEGTSFLKKVAPPGEAKKFY